MPRRSSSAISSGTSTARSRVRGNQAPSKGEAPSPAFSRILTRTSIPPRNPVSGAVRVIVVISARPPLVAQGRGTRPRWQPRADAGRVRVRRRRAGRRPPARRHPPYATEHDHRPVLGRGPVPGPALSVRRVGRTGGPPAGSRRERASGGGQGGLNQTWQRKRLKAGERF